jgi:DNA helicase-2/ATP-dependent DNA helicase PcrA
VTRHILREEAIRWPSDSPLKVVAGAGTGKTHFLVDRFVHLVEAGMPADRILGLTFTRKAAQELEGRLQEHLGGFAEASALHIYTFDSFWLQLLLEHPAQTQVQEPVSIIDDGLSRILQRRIVREVERGCSEVSLSVFEQMNLVNLSRAVSAALRVVDSAKLRLIDGKQLPALLERLRVATFPEDPNHALASETIRFIEGVARVEERLLAEMNALDYGHILLRAHHLLSENGTIRARVQKRFRHILVDEAQDTNFGQFTLLQYVAAEGFSNVTVVGDARQSIFGFRDADPRSLRDFLATICPLGKNFRSYQAILDLAVEVLAPRKPEEAPLLSANRGEAPQISVAGFVVESSREENEIIRDFVRSALDKGTPPNDIAILARARATLVPLEEMLRAEHIPTVSMVGGFYHRPEVLDARAYLAHLLSPDDRAAMARILEANPEPLSLAGIHDVIGESSGHQFEGDDEKITASEKYQHILQLRNDIADMNLSLPLRWFSYLERSGYLGSIASEDESEQWRAQANLRKLFELAHNLTMPPLALSEQEVLSYLDYSIEVGEDEVEADYGDSKGIVLTTIHRAKGLEFPIVIYCGVHDKTIQRPSGFFAHLRTRYVDGHCLYEGAGLLLPEDFEDRDQSSSLTASYKEDAADEEKRLDHVALTRAENLQIVSSHVSPQRKLPHALKTLEDLATTSSERFVFMREPTAKTLETFLPTTPSEGEPEPARVEISHRTSQRVMSERPTLRWSFSEFEEEYTKQQPQEEPTYLYADTNSQEEALQRGILVHEAIRLAGIERDWKQIPRLWDSSSISEEQIARWQSVVRKYLSSQARVFSETPFELLVEEDDFQLWLRGTIDRLEIQGDKGKLIDFKTGQWGPQAVARAERQLNFYAMAWRKGLWPEIEELTLSILHLDEGRIIEMPLNSEFESTLLDTARQTLHHAANLGVT